VLGYIGGGRLRRFEQVHLHWWGLALAGVGLQAAAERVVAGGGGGGAPPPRHRRLDSELLMWHKKPRPLPGPSLPC
jgi:hypothetical protein